MLQTTCRVPSGPAAMVDGQLKPVEMFYYKQLNIFLPLDNMWLEEITKNAIVGSVEKCIDQAIHEIETLGPTHFSCFMHFGGMDRKRVLRSMDLFGSKVMPAVEKHFGGLEHIGTPVAPQQPVAASA